MGNSNTSPECRASEGERRAQDEVKSQEDTIVCLTAMFAKRNHCLPKADSSNTCKVTLMTLPVEIRLNIYNHLLTARYRHHPAHPTWAHDYEHEFKKRIRFDNDRPQFTTNYLEPAILRTCRQISQEALSVLYGKNMFDLEPRDLLNRFHCAGSANIRMVRSLTIPGIERHNLLKPLPEHLRMLRVLADKATGLRHLEVRWYAAPRYKQLIFDKRDRGLSDDLEFVRVLAKIQNQDSLLIEEYYAKAWPAYLEKKIAVPVETHRGLRYEITHENHVLTLEADHLERHQKETMSINGCEFEKC